MNDDYGPAERGEGWIAFAGTMLLFAGVLNFIWGIAAIDNSAFFSGDAHYVIFSDLNTWGWFFLIVGVIQVLAGWAVMKNAAWAAIVGIVTAFVNAIAQISAAHTFTVWALTIVAMDVLVIYGLVKYGGGRGRTT